MTATGTGNSIGTGDGRGDAFCGAFAAAHLAGGDAVEAARRAVQIAGLAVTGPGVTPLLAT